jgi:hypothetical protein
MRLPVFLQVDPTLNDFHIPVYAKIDNNGGKITGASFSATIGFNQTLFFPTALSTGGTFTMVKQNGQRLITFDAQNVSIDNSENSLLDIIGYTMLGDTEKTDLFWVNFQWAASANLTPPTTINGSLEIAICDKGQKRLLTIIPAALIIVKPNPINDVFEIQVKIRESGEHKLELVNINGSVIELMKWVVGLDDNPDYLFKFNTDNISDGFYYILLRTPSEAKLAPVFILK